MQLDPAALALKIPPACLQGGFHLHLHHYLVTSVSRLPPRTSQSATEPPLKVLPQREHREHASRIH